VTFGEVLDPQLSSYFPNLTGFIRGSSYIHNITPAALKEAETPTIWNPYAQDLMADTNMTKVLDDLGTWNWTASDKVSMSVVEKLAEVRSDGQGKRNGKGEDGQRDPSDSVMVHVRIVVYS
jgi:transmembrane E3 ubiquitin-protein ligase